MSARRGNCCSLCSGPPSLEWKVKRELGTSVSVMQYLHSGKQITYKYNEVHTYEHT
jgi:hypothetical protein